MNSVEDFVPACRKCLPHRLPDEASEVVRRQVIVIAENRCDDVAARRNLVEEHLVTVDAGDRERERILRHDRAERPINGPEELPSPVVAVARRVDSNSAR